LDAYWVKKMNHATNTVWFQPITPGDIAYLIALVKNGQEIWDQSKRMAKKPNGDGEKKVRPLFSGGQGKKRAYGKSIGNDAGLDFYYTAEQNWMDVYNLRELFLSPVNGWERWESNDRTMKDPIRTRWIAPGEDRRKEKETCEVKKAWLERKDDGNSLEVE
jgi:hypothetical protein